jgi:oligopeptide/dipeptide ABC transporter ATP-binding protein
MEQRSPGHTVADGKIYRKGLLDFKAEIAQSLAALDFENDPEALDKQEELKAMDVSCDALIRWAERYAELAEAQALYLAPRHPYTQALISAIPVPDPRRRSQRILLTGDVPSPISPPSGCHFHQRCPHATDLCRTRSPALEACGGQGHQVACHFPLPVQEAVPLGKAI